MSVAQHRSFDQGINHDEASFLLPEGFLYSSKNMLFDKIRATRKRGGITTPGGTATRGGSKLGVLLMDDGTARYYAAYNGSDIAYIDVTTGSEVSPLGGLIEDFTGVNPVGRPFQHHGFLIFPSWASSASTPMGLSAVAGATGAVAGYTFTAPTSVSLVTNDPRITCAAADSPLAHLQVGQIIFVGYNGALSAYIGKVTKLISTTAFEVFPTPDVTVTGAPIVLVKSYNGWSAVNSTYPNQGAAIGGRVGMSYQGRVCMGAVSRVDFNGFNRNEQYPRRVYFTSTLIEGDPLGAGHFHGAMWLTHAAFPTLNYFDIPVHELIEAMSPTGFGDAVIFSAFRAFRLTGNLTTQYGTDQSITWATKEIPNSVGCMDERSLQRTPRGLIFAHDSGIYSTDGSSMRPLLYGRLENDWKALVKNTPFTIYGSALLRGNHYYICGTSGGSLWGWIVNLNNLAWSFLSGKATIPASWIINSAVQDVLNPETTWALKHYSVAGGPISMVGGQLLKLDSIFDPASSNRSDSDTTLVNFEAVTPPYAEGSPGIQKQWLGASVEYANKGGANVTVTPVRVLDSANIPAGGSSFSYLPRQDQYTVTAGTNTAPIQLTIGAHDVKANSWVIVSGIVGLTAANGTWRVESVTATTITLTGSVGNGAWASGGKVQQIDSRDIDLGTAAVGAGMDTAAMAYRINDTDSGGAGGADSFELYGITHSWEGRDPHSE